MPKILILLLSMYLFAIPPAYANRNWEMIIDDKDIKGYVRSVEGSDILEFRSAMLVNAKIEVVGAILRNVDGLKEASKQCTEVRILERTDLNNYIMYVSYSYPPPIANRDIIVKVSGKYDYEKGRAISELKAVKEPLVPLKKNSIRIMDYSAQFIVEYINREKTNIVFTSRLDPAGSIPKALVNFMSKYELRSSRLHLQEAIKNKKYINAANQSEDHHVAEILLKNKNTIKDIYAKRLGEYIKDGEFIKLVINNNDVFNKLYRAEGDVREIISCGWGSESSKKKSVALLLQLYLRTFIKDEEIIKKSIEKNDIAAKILSGQGGTESLERVIKSYKINLSAAL